MLAIDVTNHGLSDQIVDDIGIKYQTSYFSTPKRMNNALIEPKLKVVGNALVTMETDQEREDNE